MAYYVGQIRKDPITTNNEENLSYMQKIELEKIIVNSESPFGESNRYYEDCALWLNNGTVFKQDQVYYLRFKILKIPQYFYSGDTSQDCFKQTYEDADRIDITVELRDRRELTSETSNSVHVQAIGHYSVPSALLFDENLEDNVENISYKASEYEEKRHASPYSSFTVIFSPSLYNSYDTIVFKLRRNTYDAIETPHINFLGLTLEFSQVGRTWLTQIDDTNTSEKYYLRYANTPGSPIIQKKIIIDKPTIVFSKTSLKDEDPSNYGEFAVLNNIGPSESNPWIKLGYQSRPGSLIVINKEPIRVGRSGIFELDNKLPITDVRIANPGGSVSNKYIDAFLLDYAYSDKTSN